MRTRLAFALCALLGMAGPAAAQTVLMPAAVPYHPDADIAKKIRVECTQLQAQLAAYTREFGDELGVEVSLVEAVTAQMPGRILDLSITDAISMGNAFIGHQKYTRVKGTLYQDGQPVASFKGRRNSMGGAFAGYKGSCSVLGRTVKALGKDIATWLKNPEDGAELGDY